MVEWQARTVVLVSVSCLGVTGAPRGCGWRGGWGGVRRWARWSGWRERVDRVERLLEGVGVWVTEREAEDQSAAGADDPGGDVEQEAAERVGVTAQRGALVGGVSAGGGGW